MAFPSFSIGDVLAASDMNSVGSWLLETKTLTTSAGPIQFDNKFTTDYDTYLLTGHLLQNTNTATWTMQLQDASNNPITASNYDAGLGGAYRNAGVDSYGIFSQTNATADILIGGSVATDYCSFGIYLQRPRVAVKTLGSQWLTADNYSATLTNVFVHGGFVHTLATAYYGCRINISAGTVTGTVSLYGIKK